MATIEFKGIDEYAKILAKVGQGSKGIIKAAVYEGADVVADAMRNAVSAPSSFIPPRPTKGWVCPVTHTSGDKLSSISKDGLRITFPFTVTNPPSIHSFARVRLGASPTVTKYVSNLMAAE